MEEYIRILTDQIRCKKAKDLVGTEIRAHIEDQALNYREQGLEKEQALEAAVKDMGDPVEVGISMDRIHRPHIAWGMILFMAVIAMLSVMIHRSIGMANEELGTDYVVSQIAGTVIGLLAMILVCRLDYSVIAKYAKEIALFFLAVFVYTSFFHVVEINGGYRYIRLAWIIIPRTPFIYLYMPVYGALLYRYHGTGYKGIIKSVLWMLIPVYACMSISRLWLAMLMTGGLLFLLVMAIGMDWFQIKHKKAVIALFLAGAVIFPVLALCFLYFTGNMATYQMARIQSFISKDQSDFNYIGRVLAEYWGNSRIVGNSTSEFADTLPLFYQDYIVTFLAANYGILAAVQVALLMLALIIGIFYISLKQKNQLGKIMGSGCGMVFLLLSFTNFMENIGMLPVTSTHLPFFSSGGTYMVIYCILMGIVLSIYRYKSILPGGFKNYNRKRKHKLKISLSIEKQG